MNKLQELTDQITHKETATEKLDFWNSIPETDIDILFKELGESYKPISPLRIPELIYNKHFKDGLNDSEFTYWFLKFNARKLFEETLRPLWHVDEKIKSNDQVKAELNKIERFEKEANKRREDMDIYSDRYIEPLPGEYSEHRIIEYLRLKDGYYETYPLHNVHAFGNITVELYARHIYLKDFLEEEGIKVPFIGDLINGNTPEIIVDVYYRLQPDQPKSYDDIPEGYIGDLNRVNSPYQISVYGAYPLMLDWIILNLKIKDPKEKEYHKDVVWDYLKLFAKGFKDGYSNFDDYVKSKSSVFTDNQNFAQIIFDYATTNRQGNFPETFGNRKHIFSGWHNSGKEAGYFYRAWYLILENHKLFEPLFSVKSTDKKENKTRKLHEIFTVSDWQKYVDRLTTCTPELLKKENDIYTFVGNKKTQTGCVAQYFKYLKTKGIVNQSINRDELAKTLTANIHNYKVSPATIDNESNSYLKTFQDQLEKKIV